jgi:hypothetical protein
MGRQPFEGHHDGADLLRRRLRPARQTQLRFPELQIIRTNRDGERHPDLFLYILFLAVRKSFDAVFAHELAFEIRYLVGVSAEYARRLIFFQYDLVVFRKYLDRIAAGNIHFLAQFHRKNYPSELIDLSYNTG